MEMEQIFEFFIDLVSGGKPNSKFQLAKIYEAYEREQEIIEKNKVIEEKLRYDRRKHTIHRISDDIAIIQYHEDVFNNGIEEWYLPVYQDRISHNNYDSFDKALIAALSLKAEKLQTIQELRRKTNLSQREFAEYFEIPFRTVQEWEQGRRKPSDYIPKLLERIWDLENAD